MAFLLHVAKDFVVRVCVCVAMCVCLALPAWCEFILQTITVKKHVYIAHIHARTHTHTLTPKNPPTHPSHSPHTHTNTLEILTYTLTLPYTADSHARPLGQSLLRAPVRLCACVCAVLVEGYSILTLAHTATKASVVERARLANTQLMQYKIFFKPCAGQNMLRLA